MAQAIRDELIEELVQGYGSPQDLLGAASHCRDYECARQCSAAYA